MPVQLKALVTVRSSCHDCLEAGMFTFLWLTWYMNVCRVGLDVFEDEPNMKPGLAECDNCVIVPHIASASFWTRAGMVSISHFEVRDFPVDLAGLAGIYSCGVVTPCMSMQHNAACKCTRSHDS